VPTTVVVVNDDQHLSSLLEQLMAGDPRLHVVAKARTEVAASAMCWEALPEAIVVEQHAGGVQWWSLLPELRRFCPDTCMVLLTDLPTHQLPESVAVVDHILGRTAPWHELLDLLAPPVCEDEAYEQLPIAQ
jgi:DNA-binding NarL/FixJ family response regulator